MKRNNCRLCGSKELKKFLELGPQPLAGKFLRKEQLAEKESYYDLDVCLCNSCKLVQVVDIIPKDTLFSEYFYAPHALLSPHFTEYAKDVVKEYGLDSSSLVIEFGSNIGMMLKPLRDLGINAIGVEPATNIAEMANKLGLPTINNFFNEATAREIVEKHAKADIIIANNVFAHIDDLDQVLKGIKILLKENGTFIFENHYLLDTVALLQYDDIYHEHLCYYGLIPLIPFFQKWGMQIENVKLIHTHGGSIRVYVRNDPNCKPKPIVKAIVDNEINANLDKFSTYEKFGAKVHAQKNELVTLLHKLKKEGKKIVGYGAPARGNTLLNFCGIDTTILDYIIDDSPLRQGKLTPGTHIPIYDVGKFRADQPDYALLLAWGGYTDKIIKKEEEFVKRGGKFIIPLPNVQIFPE